VDQPLRRRHGDRRTDDRVERRAARSCRRAAGDVRVSGRIAGSVGAAPARRGQRATRPRRSPVQRVCAAERWHLVRTGARRHGPRRQAARAAVSGNQPRTRRVGRHARRSSQDTGAPIAAAAARRGRVRAAHRVCQCREHPPRESGRTAAGDGRAGRGRRVARPAGRSEEPGCRISVSSRA